MLKKILLGLLSLVVVVAIGGGLFAWLQIRAFDQSITQKYEVPLRTVARSEDPAVLERGKHLAESLGACFGCHGANGGGGKGEDMMPIARMEPVNITAGKNGALATYSDGELARLITHGIRRNGTSVRFMPSGDFSWWPDADVDALISYLRTLPPVDSGPSVAEIGPVGKILDRLGMMSLDTARRIDHAHQPTAPAPEPTAAYGKHIASLCQGCHGATLSGGPLPGAPASLPTPLNLTPHATGLQGWTFAEFEKVLREGIRKNGQPLKPFMPVESTKKFNDTEMKALWAYLQALPPVEFGNR